VGPAPATLANAAEDRLGKVGVVVKIVARHYAERAPAESVVATLNSLKGADRELAASILDGLVSGWPESSPPQLADADKSAIASLGQTLSPDLRDRLLVLANRWRQPDIFAGQLEGVLKNVKATLTAEGAPTGERVDAAKRLLRLLDNADSVSTILAQVTPKLSSDAATLLVTTLADSRLDDTAALIVKKWSDLTPAARKAAVGVCMRRTPWTTTLLKAVQDKKLLRGDLTASDWQLLKLHKERSISELAKKLDAANMDPDREKLLTKLLPVLERQGDVAAGKTLFTTRCAQCHTIEGAGGKVGPELTGVGAKDPKEILADIVDPNRSVEANYRMWTVDTTDGDSYSGRLDTETQTTVEIFDALGQKHIIQRKDIATMNASQLSVMPVGLIDDLKPDDIANLMAYLKSAAHPPAK
jgi:putative heme-binding domain-containing protein